MRSIRDREKGVGGRVPMSSFSLALRPAKTEEATARTTVLRRYNRDPASAKQFALSTAVRYKVTETRVRAT